MKKIYLTAILALSVCGSSVYAQQSFGGFPQSLQYTKVQDQQVAHLLLERPDYESVEKENEVREKNHIPGPYLVSTLVQTDINLSNSGTWTYLEDGSKIWRVSVTIPDAKALGLLLDQFKLPKGVSLFVSNRNGKQLLGAYTSANNDNEFGNFAIQAVQGSMVNLEMDIPANVLAGDILFHINKIGAFYRGVEDLDIAYGNSDHNSTPAKPTGPFDDGVSAACHVDANCPINNPMVTKDYEIPKKASVRILIVDSTAQGFCSGTLINNTGNSQNGTCTPYILTASHCDEGNSFSSSHFSQWLFNFNFRRDSCGSGAIEGAGMNSVLTGANFKARSYFPSIGTFSPNAPLRLVGDFLLLQLKVSPNSYGTYYAGWNRRTNITFDPSYDFFIGFHYPRGDVEKLSWGTQIQPDGNFNQTQVSGTHWVINYAVGGTEPGSSGSGLFDKDGLLIGDLSGGPDGICPIDNTAGYGTIGDYSKISMNWENSFDQTNHPRPAGQESQSRLKDWLDPTNSGVQSIGATTPDCVPAGINQVNKELDNGIIIYPTPSSTGIIYAKTNLSQPTDLQVDVYNAMGRKVKSFTITQAVSGEYSFNCSDLANGMYIIKFASHDAVTAKKFLLAR